MNMLKEVGLTLNLRDNSTQETFSSRTVVAFLSRRCYSPEYLNDRHGLAESPFRMVEALIEMALE